MDPIVIIIIILALVADFTAYRFWVRLKASRKKDEQKEGDGDKS